MSELKYRDLYHEALRARAAQDLAALALADKWQEMARAELEDVDGDPAVAMARKMCAADLRALLKGTP